MHRRGDVGNRKFRAEDIRIEPDEPAKGADTLVELRRHLGFQFVRRTATEECRRVQAPRRQFEVELQEMDEFSATRPREGVAGIQRLFRIDLLDILDDDLRFAQFAVRGFKSR
jgi:hypothetical protein